MIGLRRLSSSLVNGVICQFETKASRFKLAVSSGFLLVATGALVLGVNAHSGVADSIWGAMGVVGTQSIASGEQALSRGADTSDGRRPLNERRRAHRRGDAKLQLASSEDGDGTAPVSLGRRSMCVRLCDGFAFPVGAYHGDQDRPMHEATCRSECPGAQTALYVAPAGSDSVNDAIEARTGKSYSELPVAFHYTTVLSDACTCHPPSGNKIKSLLRDFTLRRGDAIVTAQGVRVFHGAASFPYRRTDFVALSKSRDVAKQNVGAIRAIEQASLKVPGAKTPAATAPLSRTADGTKTLQHQASLEVVR